MTKLQEINVDTLFGTSECRSWLEADFLPDGSLRLIGMGSRTDFDQTGKIIAHKCEPTGVVMTHGEITRPTWWSRIFAPNKA